MNEFIVILIPLILAHILTDFVLQSRKMVSEKGKHNLKSVWSYLHALIAGILAYLLLAEWSLHPVFWVTAGTHLAIDAVKNALEDQQSAKVFVADQLAHLAVAAGLAWWIYQNTDSLGLFGTMPLFQIGTLLLGLLLLLKPSSVLIQKLISSWTAGVSIPSQAEPTDNMPGGLPKAGHYIGLLERILIYVFVLVNQFAAIGFLIAAKSILRFGGQKQERVETEYILLGTLLSFTIAIVIALGIRMLINPF